MLDYTLSKLPSSEFEELCRDLLQKRDEVFIESFKDGRDGGIDLRYAKSRDKNIIVQAKCYKTWTELKPKLAKEAEKVKLLTPNKYVFVTSVPLSPPNKTEIMEYFSPFIKSTQDILGNQDLNNLLGLYHEVEEKYYRLWLCSTNILNTILHRTVINWSKLKLEECLESKNKFVYNQNYTIAKKILDKHNYVIISGIPGIGKTTLAEILTLEYLKDGYEDFIFIPDKIDCALELYDENKKQIFLFDDFLGSNSFEPAAKNFDSNLAIFINRIRNVNNKKFILTTREYILQEAKLHYEKLANNKMDIAKCIVGLGSYTDKNKAQILYNHLYFANIPLSSIESLLKDNKFLKIVKHKNFNPRLIETIIIQQLWNNSSIGTFYDKIYDVFEHPNRIWDIAFTKLDKTAQYALLVLVTMRVPVLLKDWREAFFEFAISTNSALCIPRDELSWKYALKVLDGCFVKTNKIFGVQIAEFFNPSIIDYLVDHLQDMHETTDLLIDNVVFADQLTTIFIQEDNIRKASRKIGLSGDQMQHLAESMMTFIDNFHDNKIKFSGRFHGGSDIFEYFVHVKSFYPRLFKDYIAFSPTQLSDEDFVFNHGDFCYKIEMLRKFDTDLQYLNKKKIIESLYGDINTAEELNYFANYIVDYPEVEFTIDDGIKDKARDIIYEEIESFESESDLEMEKDIAISIFETLGLECKDIISSIDEKMELIRDEAEEDAPDDFHENSTVDNISDAEIISQFQSLRDSGK